MKVCFNFVVHKSAASKRALKKERNRLKQMNTYVPEFTGEGPVHQWLDPKRLKHLVKFYEDAKNTHRFTYKLDSKDKKDLAEFMQKSGEIHYLRMMQEGYWMQKHQEQMKLIDDHNKSLPYVLRNDLERDLSEKEKQYYDRPELEIDKVYLEQQLRLKPEELAMNYELALRLFKIAEDKLSAHE